MNSDWLNQLSLTITGACFFQQNAGDDWAPQRGLTLWFDSSGCDRGQGFLVVGWKRWALSLFYACVQEGVGCAWWEEFMGGMCLGVVDSGRSGGATIHCVCCRRWKYGRGKVK